MSADLSQKSIPFVRRMAKRFGIAPLTAAMVVPCCVGSLLFYVCASLLTGRPIIGFAISMCIFGPMMVAPPLIVMHLRLTFSLYRTEEELQHTSEQLRVLSHRLLEIQETERRNIALELHDEIGQSLTALRIGLKRSEGSRSLESALASIHESMPTVEELIGKVRNLSAELRPSILDDFGLATALEWYVKRLASRVGFEAEFHTNLTEERFSPLLELTCYRIAQEALTNVVRHSGAAKVRVELRAGDGELRISIIDDGQGFDMQETLMRGSSGDGLGLLGMRERASLAGGRLEISSELGKGTRVHFFFAI
ncbi:MAG TPA: sensor histidine kinase [Syntrophorhabdaceae bacterium]|jgi:signal transduction histidine kinase